ncbi:hypothetical protein B0J12DRAFT_740300 [Macrophomina phaseolina]|uniref:Uncharacterized protein n=1 Tax=Macrophomina phaseolina TaxID=35725 RepID=A0ABQ8GA80_9PEZI|nr:hypothetical protein B0J12DRAFT_740300 [Macrophomina phaseolina]
MAIEEHLLTIVSKGAALAGMFTSPPESVGMAQNKYQTRQLDNRVYCKRVSREAESNNLLKKDGPRLEYPLIAKPSRGWALEGVWKAVIESSIDGPEIEANMVIIDGGLIFAEINDDFPSPGDSDMASKFANFFEDSNMIPSRLPQRELVTAPATNNDSMANSEPLKKPAVQTDVASEDDTTGLRRMPDSIPLSA